MPGLKGKEKRREIYREGAEESAGKGGRSGKGRGG